MKKNYKGIFAGLILATLSSLSFAESDPLIGKWKTIDDRTGYSRADVEIRKKADGTYEVIVENPQCSWHRKNGDLHQMSRHTQK